MNQCIKNIQKIVVGIVLAFFCITALADAAPAVREKLEKSIVNKESVMTFSNVVSLQPAIITDAECAVLYSNKTNQPATHEHALYSKLRTVSHMETERQYVNEHLSAYFIHGEVSLHRKGKETLTTPFITSLQFHTETLTVDGHFFNNYCTGNVRHNFING